MFASSFLKGSLFQEMCDSLCRCTIFLICQENDGAPANGLQKECKVSLCYWLRTLLGLAQIRKPMGFLGDGSCWHYFALEPSRSRYAKTWAVRMCNLCNPPVVRSWNDKMPNHRHQLVVWCKLSSPPLEGFPQHLSDLSVVLAGAFRQKTLSGARFGF